jgi:type IV pilus assembly protein PilN
MRIDINLASQPYEDARRFWMRWGTALGVVGVLTLALLTLTITGWIGARHDHTVMARERAMIADCDQKRAAAEKTLSLPDNRTTRDESQVLNQLIEEKAFSWTLVLENLERVMPSRIHLVAINPELGEDNQLALKMSVAGNSRDRAIELMRRMEESHRFAQTNVVSEHFLESTTNGDTEQIEIAAVYVPPQNTGPEAQKVEEKPAVAKAQAKANAKASTKTPMQGISRPPRTGAPKGNQH